MSCSIHEDLEHVGICNDCGRTLCKDCVDKFNPPTCPYCMIGWGNAVKKQFFKTAALGALLGIGAVAFSVVSAPPGSGIGIMTTMSLMVFIIFAGIPWGWSTLSKITPQVFLFMPIGGWMLYFGVKLLISFYIGFCVMPFYIWKYIKNMKLVQTAYDI